MINRFDVVVERFVPAESVAWLRMARGRLAARTWPGIRAGRTVAVAIEPEDVVLCESHPGRTSARNVLPGHVREVRVTRDGAFVTLEVGFPLTALVTRKAATELRLRRGVGVFALVKASSVRPVAGATAAFRVSLIGARGLLTPEHVDFLREIARTGSLSAAARDLGLHYRTAWMRARTIHRLWGTPLVARAAGGRGGGGTALTPVGLAVLRLAERLERGRA